ncbi:phytoene desaturase family protein [Paludisphaera mucosa]|uniref:Phytoene desaturase family protein n=1 Tax=Paludisphaera mucosa TaxID=3030827 RepID=A0ABT6F7D9_9BACT|nr:phytoene desaturase family protein [Paludisphaera mucosa]MDG3003510.1 phytoene desaturase family protein [Paludisphaera mucosa]
MPGNKRVVVVGAGPGGLAAAMLLSAAGCSVKVLERLPHVGGRTSSFEADGFRFDLGPTFFLYPRVLESIFAAVGRDLHRETKMVRLDPQYHLVFGAGGEVRATPDLERMEREIGRLSPHDASQLRRFLADNRVKMDQFRAVLESPFLRFRDMMSPKLARMLPLLRPWLSLDGELKRYFRDPRIRLAMTFQSKYLGMSPFNCPSLFSILSFLEYEYGVFHPIGGCGAVSEAMARVAEDQGTSISLDDEVEEILFEGKKAVAVRSRSGVHACDALVINADFARAMTRLVPDALRPRWSDRKIARKKFSCSTYMLYLGIEGRYDDLSHHTIYLAKDYLENLSDIESRHVLSRDPSFYVQNACITDPSLAPEGKSTLYVLLPVTHQHANVDWESESPRFRELAIHQLRKIGLEDVESRIVFERQVTPANWDQDYEIHLGATFNLAHSLSQMLYLRPRNRFENLKSVYLVGGGTHPGSGLPVIFESAKITAKLVGQDLGVPVSLGSDDGLLSSSVNLFPAPHAGVGIPEEVDR